MTIDRKSIDTKRESTDASLIAERAGADALSRRTSRAQHDADDRIERERIIADDRLRKFRDRVDVVLAADRRASPGPFHSPLPERVRADDAKIAERALNDAALEDERQRSDDALLAQRSALEIVARAHRADTDEKLGEERLGVDLAVTSLGTATEALTNAEEQIDRRDTVLSMVAHELRNPLAVIAMNADFIAAEAGDSEVGESASEVQHSVALMQRLIQDLLDLACIEAGMLRVVKRPFDVGALLAEIEAAYEPLFAKRGLSFACAPPPPSLVATFDHDRVVQVISNLLGNAMKMTPRGGSVRLCALQRDDGVEFVVEDTGVGIAASSLPHLFDRFWQANRDRSAGLGLGLYICEKIVAAHEGRIWVESELGKGTAFRFELPISPRRENERHCG